MTKTHKTHWTMPQMPWKKKREEPYYGELRYCHCGNRGVYFLNRWYCQECWDIGDDEDWHSIGGGYCEDSKGNRWLEGDDEDAER